MDTSLRFSQEHIDRPAAQLRARMRHLCGHMSPELFEAMIADMARIQLKYEAMTVHDVLGVDAKPGNRP